MKLGDFDFGHTEQIRVVAAEAIPAWPDTFKQIAEVRLQYSERRQGTVILVDQEAQEVRGASRRDELLIEQLGIRHLPCLIWLIDVAPDYLTLRVHTFVNELVLPFAEFGVDESVFESLARTPALRNREKALAWLNDQFLLATSPDPATVRAFATANVGLEKSGFALYGKTARAFLRQHQDKEGHHRWVLDKVVRGSKDADGALTIVMGDIRFVDATVASQLRADAAAELASLVSSGGSFLKLWSEYGALESETTLARAREAGSIPYEHCASLADGSYCFTIAQNVTKDSVEAFIRTLKKEQALSVEAGPEVPRIITEEMTWEEHEGSRRGRQETVTFRPGLQYFPRDLTVILMPRDQEDRTPPASGHLYISLMGDKKRLERREIARRAIVEATCPMPQLGLLLEGKPVAIPRRLTLPGIKPAISRKVFGNRSPTPAQQAALDVALNTPDIALIQGPPGTGKTTVIVALAERLLTELDATGGIQGRLLLSGFQHDAVENAIQRMRVLGLPPIKFGDRPGQLREQDRVESMVEAWAHDRARELQARHIPSAFPLRDEVSAILQAYLLAPGPMVQTIRMLDGLAARLDSHVSEQLLHRLRALRDELEERLLETRTDDADLERLLRLVRALRSTPASFADDGPRNAYKVMTELIRYQQRRPDLAALFAEATPILNAAASGTTSADALNAIVRLRRGLLLALLPRDLASEVVPRTRTDVVELLGLVRDDIEARRASRRSGAAEAVDGYIAAFQGDPVAVKDAIISYTSVFAATCQQAARESMTELKNSEIYDSVIVDEAARANPLDLFIPLARAQRRIVLVGDHRQLPHILDKKLEDELEAALGSGSTAEQETVAMLKQSLFERLFESLRQREAQDGIRRTVTLDEQYRMHPALGDFVSRHFYEPYGEAFRSPRPATDFVHDLPCCQGPAAWLPVAAKLGPELQGKSKARPVEARHVVAELKRLMDSEPGRKLTFGVITFYAAQVTAIIDALVGLGIATRDEEDGVEILDPYRMLLREDGRSEERLRIGTVDAFQGMEFDVVFLSMVRSSTLPEQTEQERRRKFGHLMSPNRLCVAMSRQKRLLIVAGDEQMLRTPGAVEAIGPLVHFREMSEVIRG